MSSIRRFLLSGTLGVVATVTLASSVLSYYSARHEIEEIYDATLVQYARLLQELLGRGRIQPGDVPAAAVIAAYRDEIDSERLEDASEYDSRLVASLGHWYERNFVFQLWDRDHRLRASNVDRSRTALAAFEAGLSNVSLDGDEWRVLALFDDAGGQWLFVGERLAVRDELVTEIALSTITPGLLALPVALALVYWLIGRGLAPLMRMTHAIARRAPGNLQPIDLDKLPAEVAPLNTAINRLLASLESALQRERRLTADAAHELRTPLAVLRVHAQNALNADNETARNKALSSLVTGVDRTAHLVGQLLSLAHVSHDREAPRAPLDFALLVREEIAGLTPLALARHQQLRFDTAGRGVIDGDDVGLRALVRNLVDNAIRYAPDGGDIVVSLRRNGERLRLRVADSGPGIPETLRSRVFDSFYRPADSHGEGVGLGLSIVQHVATRHEAPIAMGREEQHGRFYVDVSFAARG